MIENQITESREKHEKFRSKNVQVSSCSKAGLSGMVGGVGMSELDPVDGKSVHEPGVSPVSDDADKAGMQDGPKRSVSLKNYQAGELAGQLAELLSLPDTVIKGGLNFGGFVVVFLTVYNYVVYNVDLGGLWWVLFALFSVPVAIIFGGWFTVFRLAGGMFDSVEEVLRLILKITEQAAKDSEDLKSGQGKMPGGGKMVEEVYEQVALPVMEKVVGERFKFLGKPVFWLYRRTICVAVRKLIKLTQKKRDEEEVLSRELEEAIEGMGEDRGRIVRFSRRAQGLIGQVSSKTRGAVGRPVSVIYVTGLCLVAGGPLVLMKWFLS